MVNLNGGFLESNLTVGRTEFIATHALKMSPAMADETSATNQVLTRDPSGILRPAMYGDAHYPFVYNYHVENYNNPFNNPFNTWGAPAEYCTAQPHESNATEPEGSNKQAENNMSDSGVYTYNSDNSGSYDQSQSPKDRLTLCTSIPPQSPQMELYSPMIPIHPGTPVIYAHTPEMAEVLVPAPVQMYTPPVDVQYISPGPFMYPTTPPAAWYPPGINSQGFIFPAPVNQK